MTFEVKARPNHIDEWIVGAIDEQSEGEMYIAIFTGFAAEPRAHEYAAWKNGQPHPKTWALAATA